MSVRTLLLAILCGVSSGMIVALILMDLHIRLLKRNARNFIRIELTCRRCGHKGALVNVSAEEDRLPHGEL